MLTPSKLWPGTALDVAVYAVGLTTGAATPLNLLLLPCFADSLRSAAASPRVLSGSRMLLSCTALVAVDPNGVAPATPISVTAAAASSDRTNTARQRRFTRI